MLWLKAFHIIAIVTWFSGLFYVPRLFAYHADSHDAISIERFQVMEHRLYYFITTPSAIITVLLGLALIGTNSSYYMQAGWLHTKILLVIGLVGFHVYCGICLQRFKRDTNQKSASFYKRINEIPTLFLVSIVLLAVLKPF